MANGRSRGRQPQRSAFVATLLPTGRRDPKLTSNAPPLLGLAAQWLQAPGLVCGYSVNAEKGRLGLQLTRSGSDQAIASPSPRFHLPQAYGGQAFG